MTDLVDKTIRIFTYDTATPITATKTTVFSGQDSSALGAATYVPMVTLINRGETPGGGGLPRPGGNAAARTGAQWAFLVAMVAMTMGSVFIFSIMSI